MKSSAENLLIAWYGDDFTGAAAVLEVLSFAGLRALLFLEPPTQDQLAHYSGLHAIGIASTARAQSPEWMLSNLPTVFESLQALQPELIHYKICTTLDSSSTTGSIGCAIEIATDVFNVNEVPVLVAAPQMRRFQFFGHLFAALGDDVYRLDRHPVMARHPVTPMTESDVALHISEQSQRISVSLWSLEDIALDRGPLLAATKNATSNTTVKTSNAISAFTIDCIDERSELAVGRRLWEHRETQPFVVGSQGVEFALVRHWQDTNMLPEKALPGSAGRSLAMVIVSGSVSPTTAEQIAWSRANGFATIRFDVMQALAGPNAMTNEVARVVDESRQALSAKLDPLVFTAEGPDDPVVKQLTNTVKSAELSMADINVNIGMALGNVLHQILMQSDVRRAVVSGGDTSGYVTRQLGIFALSALAPTIPGASLSRAHADGPMDGLELALKGGQMGSPDYFGWIREGGGIR